MKVIKTEEPSMNMLSKREYLQAITRRYHRSSKRVKSNILDEFCTICGYNRSYAIRLLNQGHKRKRRKPGRHSRYGGADFTQALKRIWLASEQLCGRRLKECMSWYVEYYPKHHGELSPEVNKHSRFCRGRYCRNCERIRDF